MVCVGTIAGLAAGMILANVEPLVIATDASFPEYIYLDANGVITGFERDVMDRICRQISTPCTWVDTNFENLIPGVISGTYDVVLGGMAITDERRAEVDFTQSYYQTDDIEWYIGRPGAPDPDNAMIAVQSGTVHHAHLRASGRRFESFSTEAEALAALSDGAADLAFGPYENRADLKFLISDQGFDFLYSESLPDDGVAMAVCKGNISLLANLNSAIATLRADGTLAALETRWFN